MSTQVLLPKIGFASDDSTLARWLAQDGAMITAGQPLYELENDKATQEVEAPASGRLRILAEVGMTYPVGAVLAEIDH
jgi:pyruvate/2-oxoglutarate dehydrogenase complex dihydrolipoamide acyltransferase (E2) component